MTGLSNPKTAAHVATGAASRLRLKRHRGGADRQCGSSGNRGGFSFEIETMLLVMH